MAAQLLQSVDGGLVLVVGDGRLPAGHDFPPEGEAQHADACRVETFVTGGGSWRICLRHNWQRLMPLGSGPVPCPAVTR